jgi:hypothetical protein
MRNTDATTRAYSTRKTSEIVSWTPTGGDRTRLPWGAPGELRYICQIGRTSTNPFSPIGTFFAHSSASSFEAHSIR